MSVFPVTIGGTQFDTVAQLVDHIRDRAHNAVPRHPNDGHPVQWYLEHVTQPAGGDVETALWHASDRIVRDSDDTRVLEMAVFLCGRCGYELLYEAVLDRLERKTRAFPKAAGLETRFASLALNALPLRDAALGSRFRAYCEQQGHHELVVSMLLGRDPHGDLLTAVQHAVAGQGLAVPVVMGLGTEVARNRQGEILLFAKALSKLSTRHRNKYLAQVQKWAPDWFDANGAALRAALAVV